MGLGNIKTYDALSRWMCRSLDAVLLSVDYRLASSKSHSTLPSRTVPERPRGRSTTLVRWMPTPGELELLATAPEATSR